MSQVGLDRPLTDEQLGTDFGRRQAQREKPQDLRLPGREAGEGVHDRVRRKVGGSGRGKLGAQRQQVVEMNTRDAQRRDLPLP